ncbi:GntR family transcriptional regulator (plasmid) [Photobacterium sp. DA100]|uniref:GntR family transcriptional regulator n=1 Tax=Photobacterium sp. DA100 TaxID=3027472 RepID=UPI002479D076|nr:GntR family transcriptional regulator [Photobacterium sp. DA100]WEM44239.1 GntR family transcriptional regulator [Photobacterium sp. DA100]
MVLAQQIRRQLDDLSGTPLYMQLISVIKSAITKGQLQPGDALPSERELGEVLGIARGTVRKSYQKLLEEGILLRIKGSGTFIAPRVSHSMPLLESFSEMADAMGSGAHSELVGYLRRPPTQEESRILHITDVKSEVVELTRLRKVGAVVVSVQKTILPGHLMNNINDLAESLYQLLETRKVPVLSAKQRFSVTVSDSKLAHYLNIKEHHPLLLVTRTGYTHNDTPVEYTFSWCLNDYHNFTIELHRDGH